MKQVVRKILILLVIVFAINLVIQKIYVPYDWGDDVLQTKNEFYDIYKDSFNTVFIGGSLFYRHVDGHQFDSLNALNGITTKTFNYGADGNNHIKQMILLDKLLDSKDDNLKYIFFALSSNSYFESRNLHTKKFVTWINWKSLRYAIKVAMNEDASLRQRLTIAYQYTLSWIENKLNAGMGMYLVQYKLQEEKKYSQPKMIQTHLGKKLDGFRPYALPEGVDSVDLSYANQLLYWSNNHFNHHHEEMDTIMDWYEKDLIDYNQNGGHLNKAMLKKYNQLIEKADKKGIQLIALIPPRSRLPYSTFLPLYDELPDKNKMNLGLPEDYPAFYDYDKTFNFYHMNGKGAKIYTEELAKTFRGIAK